MVAAADSVPGQEVDDDSSVVDVGTIKGKVLEYCGKGALDDGVCLIIEGNYLEVREVTLHILKKKSAMGSFILKTVEETKTKLLSSVGKEKVDAEIRPWRVTVQGLDRNYFL